jgi:hypothetical protein
MKNTEVGKRLDAENAELEKHLPEWFILIRKLVAEHLYAHSPPGDANTNAMTSEGHDKNKTDEVKL